MLTRQYTFSPGGTWLPASPQGNPHFSLEGRGSQHLRETIPHYSFLKYDARATLMERAFRLSAQ